MEYNLKGQPILDGKTQKPMKFDEHLGTFTASFRIAISEKTKLLEKEKVFIVVKAEQEFIKPYVVERLSVISHKKRIRVLSNPN